MKSGPANVRESGKKGGIGLGPQCRVLLDYVAELKNELTAQFRAAPAAPDIWQSNASQRAYEGRRLRIGLIMCPLHNFLVSAAPLQTFVRTPKKSFATQSR
jgi:hypothetical protein